ncbi:MAG: hypothetical protein K6E33_06330 [Lachnospiraceae bacterium]|nr:hypothetical protein [Lachnospiraceae bacterium]
MEMGSMVDVMIAGCGIYLIWAAWSMIRGGDIPKPLLPASMETAAIKEKKGIGVEIGKRTLVMGIAAVICGGMDAINEMYIGISAINIVLMVLFVVVTVWYCISVRKLYRQ